MFAVNVLTVFNKDTMCGKKCTNPSIHRVSGKKGKKKKTN